MSTVVKFGNVTLEASYDGLWVKKGFFTKTFVTWACLEEVGEEVSTLLTDGGVAQVNEPLSGSCFQQGLEFTICNAHGRVDMMVEVAKGLIPIVGSLYKQYRWYR